jgi:hypothetical protein
LLQLTSARPSLKGRRQSLPTRRKIVSGKREPFQFENLRSESEVLASSASSLRDDERTSEQEAQAAEPAARPRSAPIGGVSMFGGRGMPMFDAGAARGRLRSAAGRGRGGSAAAAAEVKAKPVEPTASDAEEPQANVEKPIVASGAAVRIAPMGFDPSAVKLRSATSAGSVVVPKSVAGMNESPISSMREID